MTSSGVLMQNNRKHDTGGIPELCVKYTRNSKNAYKFTRIITLLIKIKQMKNAIRRIQTILPKLA